MGTKLGICFLNNKVFLIVNFLLGLAICKSVDVAWDIEIELIDTLLGIYILCYSFCIIPFIILLIERMVGIKAKWYFGLSLTVPMYWPYMFVFGDWSSQKNSILLLMALGLAGAILQPVANWLGEKILNFIKK